MTIALGVLTPQWMVVAADSEESIGGDFKLSTSTIHLNWYMAVVNSEGAQHSPALRCERTAVVTGAGDSGYLAAMKEKISDLFNGKGPLEGVRSLQELDGRLRIAVEDFYTKHVLPFNGPNDDALRVRLIICASVLGQSAMWSTYHNTVRMVNLGVEAVGSGERWAVSTFPPLLRAITGSEITASVLAVNAVRVAKLRALDCGKETQLIAVNRFSGVPKIAVTSVAHELEVALEEYDTYASKVLQFVSGLKVGGIDTRTDLKTFRDRIDDIALRLYIEESVPIEFRQLASGVPPGLL